jgi:hypothetical protein
VRDPLPSLSGVMSQRRRRSRRDHQAESPFSILLDELIAAHAFVRGAAIVDSEGESVDYAGELDPYEVRVAAATFQLLITELSECHRLGEVHQVVMLMGRAGYLLRILDPSYCLLVVLRKAGTFCVSERLLHELETRFLDEAGLPVAKRPTMTRVDVEMTSRGPRARPVRIRPLPRRESEPREWTELEVLGVLVGSNPGERAFRVRLSTGAELTLLRDASRLWFTEEKLEQLLNEEGTTTAVFDKRVDRP